MLSALHCIAEACILILARNALRFHDRLKKKQARRATKQQLLTTEQGAALAALAAQNEEHGRLSRENSRHKMHRASSMHDIIEGASTLEEALAEAAGEGEGSSHDRERRLSVSERRLAEIRADGRRDAEDLLLTLETEKERQHEHMLRRLGIRCARVPLRAVHEVEMRR